MKKTVVTFFFASVMVLSCNSQKNNISYSYDDDGRNPAKHSIVIDDEKGSLELKYAGEISFTEEETALKNISSNGYLNYKRNGKKISVINENGRLVYEVNGGNKKTTLNAEESMLLSQAIKTMIEYGVGAKDRVERIYKKGGNKAVLAEVVKMKSDYVKSVYLDYLLAGNSLSSTDMAEVAGSIKTLLESDFEKGKLLGKFSSKYLADPTAAEAYLNAVKSIGSDFEKADAVKKILGQPLSPAQFTAVLQVVNNIESDFEKANVLKQVLHSNKISATQFSEVLKSTALIESDFEKGNVLVDIAAKMPADENVKAAYMKAAKTISSDHDYGRVMRAVK